MSSCALRRLIAVALVLALIAVLAAPDYLHAAGHGHAGAEPAAAGVVHAAHAKTVADPSCIGEASHVHGSGCCLMVGCQAYLAGGDLSPSPATAAGFHPGPVGETPRGRLIYSLFRPPIALSGV